MSKRYKVVERKVVKDDGYITIVIAKVEDRFDGSLYEGKGIARKSPDDTYDANIGKDLAEVRAIKDAVKKMKASYYEGVEYYSKKLNEFNNKVEGLDSNIENLDYRIDLLIDSVRN